MRTIAIIGCGAAAVAFIRSLVNEYDVSEVGELKLIIFEPAQALGVGQAYQEDFNNLLINRPAQTMSASSQFDEFFEWLKEKQELSHKTLDTPSIFPARKLFGYYLTDMLEKALHRARHIGIHIIILNETVIRIREGTPFFIETQNKNNFLADYIVLTVGNNQPRDFYSLKNTSKYIHSPYPLQTSLQGIKSLEDIGIIGNSLTAIDVALSLKHLKHQGLVAMLSRAHVYPRVRSLSTPYNLQFLTSAAVHKKKSKLGKFTLRDALRLLRRELASFSFFWKTLFVEHRPNITFLEYLRAEIKAAKKERKWQAILAATNQVVEDIWHAFDQQSKAIFIKYYQRIWLNNRSPIPVENAHLLLELVQQKKLLSVSGLKDLQYDHAINKYIAKTKNQKNLQFDWIINATGPSRFVQPEDKLVYNLIQEGLAREHQFGGIDVDFHTTSVINNKGQLNPRLRLIGHNTIGVYNYTSSLEMIVNKAIKLARNLLLFIKEDRSHDENRMANITNFDSIGHFAQIIH